LNSIFTFNDFQFFFNVKCFVKTREGVDRAVRFMRQRLARDLTVEEIARAAAMSVSTLTRSFRAAVGEPPARYLVRLRISAAIDLLRTGALSIAEIAAQTGFADSNYFTKTFVRLTGQPPTSFRKKLRIVTGKP
jgi:transcriptional regulator GlxA family with amidase domain